MEKQRSIPAKAGRQGKIIADRKMFRLAKEFFRLASSLIE